MYHQFRYLSRAARQTIRNFWKQFHSLRGLIFIRIRHDMNLLPKFQDPAVLAGHWWISQSVSQRGTSLYRFLSACKCYPYQGLKNNFRVLSQQSCKRESGIFEVAPLTKWKLLRRSAHAKCYRLEIEDLRLINFGKSSICESQERNEFAALQILSLVPVVWANVSQSHLVSPTCLYYIF